jgi:alpha-galactosidase
MGDSEVLTIRFHFDGIFVLDGSTVQYCNGIEGVSHIEKDKLSIPKLEGHLLDHTTFKRSVRMYWLPFGAAVSSGMRLLVDDKTCLDMVESVGSDGAVDVYTELIDVDMSAISETNIEDGIGYEAMFDLFRDENVMNLDPPITLANAQLGDQTAEDDNIIDLDAAVRGEDESDSEIDATGFTTDEDDEAKEIRTKYKAYMSTIKKRRGIPSDPPAAMDLPTGNDHNNVIQVDDYGDGIASFDSDENVSYDDDSETEGKRRKCRFPVFDSHAETPQFALNMCFRGKKELKDALTRYALKMKVNIKFPKNDNRRLWVFVHGKVVLGLCMPHTIPRVIGFRFVHIIQTMLGV